ncbi:MAG: glycosyltransferase family 39 protein [Anaerolineales bacterium]|nr:glycosyltransferase family 39 protein [Anaerolineales bacterium]
MSIGIFGGVIGLGTILQPRVDKVFCRFAKKLHTPPVQFVFMLSALQFALVAGISSVYSATAFNQALATLSWGLGVSAVILGGWVSGYTKRKPDWQSVLWFTMLTSVAFLLRGIRTSHIPISMTGDEGNFGLWAYQMALGKPNNLFETGSYGFPTLYMFIQSILIRFLGPTSQAIRLSSALIGGFTVGCTYLFGKSLLNHRVGAFAGIFLAFFHFHIHFSRLGLNNIWDGFWFVLVFAAFWEGWLTRKKNAFILSGLGMGFSQYFYASARLLPFILLFWISVLAFADRPRFRKQLLEIGVLFFAALIVVLPLGIYFFAHPSTYFDPMHQTNIFGIWSRGGHEGFTNFWSFLFAQLRLGFLAYTSAPVVFFYDPGIPILRALPAFFFALGLFVLVGFHQNAKTWLFLLWLIVIALVGALSKPTPSAQRYIAAAPGPGVDHRCRFGSSSGMERKNTSH